MVVLLAVTPELVTALIVGGVESLTDMAPEEAELFVSLFSFTTAFESATPTT